MYIAIYKLHRINTRIAQVGSTTEYLTSTYSKPKIIIEKPHIASQAFSNHTFSKLHTVRGQKLLLQLH